jgi:PIN domain nuclease of toxin-antitoxin system
VNSGFLLDTHAALWISEDQPIGEAAVEALDEAADLGTPVLVSPISAWEIGMLVARNRISLAIRPSDWFRRLLQIGGVALAPMPPEVLIASSFLPGDAPRDPADRILAATARDGNLRLITRDRVLLGYAEAGHLRAIPC